MTYFFLIFILSGFMAYALSMEWVDDDDEDDDGEPETHPLDPNYQHPS